MKSKISNTLIVLVLCFVFFGCKKSNDSTSPASEIWPLKINNKWTYNFTVFREDGTIRENEKYTITVRGDTLISGIKFYELETLYLRNADNNTVEAASPTLVTIPYIKKSEVDGDRYYNTTTTIGITGGSCTAKTYYKSYTGSTNINGHSCLKNEEVYEDCSGGIRVKIIKYYKPGLGLVLTEKYSIKLGSPGLYLASKDILESYKLY